MLPGTSGQFSQHSDVLAQTPETDSEVQNLVAELRRRGNLAFKNKSYMEADMLYTKAIEVFPKDAAIYGNRSAARLAMKNFKLALDDANQAVKIGGFPKGHFRRGQALAGLLRYRDAQQAFEACAQADETTREAMEKEANKMRLLAEEQENKKLDSPPPLEPIFASSSEAKKPIAAAKQKKETAATTTTEEVVNESDLMKGYKVLDNGKKTTFFHREISAEQKAKLDLANKPQAISSPAQVQANTKAGSKWNAAGTFEEKDMTKFATERITELLKECSTVMGEGTIVEVTGVTDFDGSASHTVIRGARKAPFDFTFNVEWAAHINDPPVTGKLFCSQCTNSAADLEVEFEIRWENRSKAGAEEKNLLQHLKGEFRQELEAKLLSFAQEFTAVN